MSSQILQKKDFNDFNGKLKADVISTMTIKALKVQMMSLNSKNAGRRDKNAHITPIILGNQHNSDFRKNSNKSHVIPTSNTTKKVFFHQNNGGNGIAKNTFDAG